MKTSSDASRAPMKTTPTLSSARFWAIFVLLFDFGLSLLAWQYAEQQTKQELHDYFMFRVREARTVTEHRLLSQVEVLRGAQGLFVASSNVSHQSFQDYVSSLHLDEYYPGIQGVGFIPLIAPNQLDAHTDLVRQESGFQAYVLRPDHKRTVYSSIALLEPFYGRNLKALGLDLLTIPTAQAAMVQARDTGQVSLTGKLMLTELAEHDQQTTVLMFLPVYDKGRPHGTVQERRKHILGWVFSPIRMEDFATGMYGEHANDLDIELYDGIHLSPEEVLYDSTLGRNTIEGRYPLWATEQVTLGGHVWSLVVRSQQGLESRVNVQLPLWVLFVGLCASILFSMLSWLLFSGRDRANRLAMEMNRELVVSTQALHDSEAKLKAVLNASEVAIAWANKQGYIEYVNTKFILLFGYSLDDVPTIDQWYLRAYPNPEYREKVVGEWELRVAASLPLQTPIPPYETVVCCRDGSMRDVLIMASWADDKLLATFSDLTWRKHAEEDLRKLSIAVEQNPAAVVITDTRARIEYVNPRFSEITGYQASEVIGQNPRILQSGETPLAVYQDMWDHLLQGLTWTGELRNKRSNGELYWEEVRISPVKNPLGQTTHYVAIKNDITERKHQEDLIKQMAHYDNLTGLPNRSLLSERLNRALMGFKREQNQPALIFIDLDKFKPINDELGHHIGDKVLIEVAHRMLECVREIDTVARLGGDEFVVLLPDVDGKAGALQVAEKIRLALEQSIVLEGRILNIGSSLGVAICPIHGQTEHELVHSADMAMYHAKELGRNCVVLYREGMAPSGE